MTEQDKLMERSRYLFQTQSLLHQQYQRVVLSDADFIKDCKESKYKELDEIEKLVESLVNTNKAAIRCNDMIYEKIDNHMSCILYLKHFNEYMERMIIIIGRILEIYDWYVNKEGNIIMDNKIKEEYMFDGKARITKQKKTYAVLPDQEIINKWIEELNNQDISSVIEEAYGTISNERIWLKGSDVEEQISAHKQNIATLEEYIRRLHEIDIAKRIWDIAKISPEYGNYLMDFLGDEVYDKVMKIQGGGNNEN